MGESEREQVFQQLRSLVEDQDEELWGDPKRCKAYLFDLCPTQRKEVNLLLRALEERVPQRLRERVVDEPLDQLVPRFARQLADHHYIDEAALEWAVKSWALALRVDRPVPEAQDAPEPSGPEAKAGTAASFEPKALAVEDDATVLDPHFDGDALEDAVHPAAGGAPEALPLEIDEDAEKTIPAVLDRRELTVVGQYNWVRLGFFGGAVALASLAAFLVGTRADSFSTGSFVALMCLFFVVLLWGGIELMRAGRALIHVFGDGASITIKRSGSGAAERMVVDIIAAGKGSRVELWPELDNQLGFVRSEYLFTKLVVKSAKTGDHVVMPFSLKWKYWRFTQSDIGELIDWVERNKAHFLRG